MTRLSLCLLMILSCKIAVVSQTWVALRPGLDMLSGGLSDQGHLVHYILLRYDSKQLSSLHIIDTYNKIGSRPYSEYSIDAIERITGATVVVNAGATQSYTLPNPAGLLKVDGTVISRIDTGIEHGGVLCVSRRGVLSMYEVSGTLDPNRMAGSNCSDAVQRGPFLSSRAPSLPSSSGARFRRTVAGLDGDGNLYIMVTKDGATLPGISEFFFGRQANLGVLTLLNFDGDESSGLIIRGRGSTPIIEVGNTHGLVASAIAIY